MIPFDRFAVVLDACTVFPMLVRDVLLTLAAHEFFSPKWSPRIRDEWTRNLIARMRGRDDDVIARTKVERYGQPRLVADHQSKARPTEPPPRIPAAKATNNSRSFSVAFWWRRLLNRVSQSVASLNDGAC
jgi:hypothetical protein